MHYNATGIPGGPSIPDEPVEPDLPDHTHIPGSQWASGAAGHWHVCSVCNAKTDVAKHTFVDGTCSVCGFKQSDVSTGTFVDGDSVKEDSDEYTVISKPTSISGCTKSVIKDKVYTGDPLTPALTIKKNGKTLKDGVDYRLTYEKNINAGTAKVRIHGIGIYNGTDETTFKINPKALNKLTVVTDIISTGSVTGNPIHIFDGAHELVKDKDYKYTFDTAVKGGNKVTIENGSGSNYANGTKKLVVKVTAIDIRSDKNEKAIAASTINLSKDNDDKWSVDGGVLTTTFDGKAKIPDVEVKDGDKVLTKGVDYTLSFKSNKNAGTAYAIIKGKGSTYKGKAVATFTIKPADVDLGITINKGKEVIYTGKALRPAIAVTNKATSKKLAKNKDYIIRYRCNVKSGSGYVTITGIKNYAGMEKTCVFNISKRDINKVSKSIKNTSNITLKYAGKTLEKDVDYTVSIEDSAAAGKKKVTITGLGNFDKSFTKDKIKP